MQLLAKSYIFYAVIHYFYTVQIDVIPSHTTGDKLLVRLLSVLGNFENASLLISNQNPENEMKVIGSLGNSLGITSDPSKNSFDSIKNAITGNPSWWFGHFSYDLKNENENLVSKNFDGINFSQMRFFQPDWLVLTENNKITIHSTDGKSTDELFQHSPKSIFETSPFINLKSRTNKKKYVLNAKKLIEHIHRGVIYEINYCIEFFAEKIIIDPTEVFKKLNSICEAPFSALYKNGDQWLICASPERFLQKKGNKLISQPIKGTRPRGKNETEDEQLKKELFLDPKERSENVMIVDLVRNDLSKSAKKGSVNVEELFGIHTFKTVHQMVSTISAELDENVNPVDAIRNAFPMGSMTGAPKVRAMELAEEFEDMKRGLYSGAVGYFSPDGDFDFNVVIRSIQYNAKTGYLSIMVGSALTANADPEKEYEECLLKAKALFESLNATLIQD